MNIFERMNKLAEARCIENAEGKKRCLWLSFCDPCLPKGSQFLGVIVTKSFGFATAIDELHGLGINPGGEVKCIELQGQDEEDISTEDYDRLMSREYLSEAGYI